MFNKKFILTLLFSGVVLHTQLFSMKSIEKEFERLEKEQLTVTEECKRLQTDIFGNFNILMALFVNFPKTLGWIGTWGFNKEQFYKDKANGFATTYWNFVNSLLKNKKAEGLYLLMLQYADDVKDRVDESQSQVAMQLIKEIKESLNELRATIVESAKKKTKIGKWRTFPDAIKDSLVLVITYKTLADGEEPYISMWEKAKEKTKKYYKKTQEKVTEYAPIVKEKTKKYYKKAKRTVEAYAPVVQEKAKQYYKQAKKKAKEYYKQAKEKAKNMMETKKQEAEVEIELEDIKK